MPDFLDRLRGQESRLEPLLEDSDLEQFFTDAEYACQAFEDLVSADAMPKRLLVIHGVGGVGKSTLLKMYRLSCYRRGIPVALVGAEDAPSSVDVLSGWADDLSRMGVKLRTFANTLDHYRALGAKVEEEAKKAKEAMRGAAEKAGKAAAKTAVEMVASAIPVIGPLAAALGGAGTEAAIDWLRGFLSKPDLDLYLDPSKRLTTDFLEDLTRAGAKQRIVLMVDTYEQITALDDWMRELTGALPDNVLLVIAGRALPAWDRAWPGWMGRAQIIELKEMTEEDLANLVQRYYAYIRGGEPDPLQVKAIVQFARGLPIAATTVVQLWMRYGVEDFQAVRPQVVADLADRLLEGVPPAMRPVFEVAAVLRYFNVESLQALLEEGSTGELYAELRRWPFIRPRREGLAVHDTMREVINEALLVRAPARLRTLHEQAAAYYEAWLEKATGGERERLILERLYHHVCADEEVGIQQFQEIAEKLVQYWLTDRLRALLNDADTYTLERETSRLWREYYNARLAHLEVRLAGAEEVYQEIVENEQAEPRLRAYALSDWGHLLSYYERLGQPGGVEKATSTLKRSLGLVPLDFHLVRSFFHLARVQRYQAKWDEQATSLKKAKEFFEQSNDEYGLAYVYSEMQRGFATRGLWRDLLSIQEQLEDLSRRLPESAVLKSRILRWSWSWALTGRLSEGEQKARESIDFIRSMDDTVSLFHVYRDLGWVLGFQGRYIEADQHFSKSLTIAQRLGKEHAVLIGSVLGLWGAVLTRQGEIDKATEYLSKSLSIKEELGDKPGMLEPLVWLGRLCEVQQDLDQAQEYYNRCSDWSKYEQHYFDSESLTGLMRVKHARGDRATIPPQLAEAEQLAQQYEYNDHLASLRLTQGRIAWDGRVLNWGSGFDAALHYYQQALIYALRYNRFLLDEVLWGGGITTPLRPIISSCLEQGEEGFQMLVALRDWWQSGVNDVGLPRPDTISPIEEGIPLLEAERIARVREPGDGKQQMAVVEKITQELEGIDGS
jgi:tetratricopeptide (TPR) repeat protein